MVKQETFLLSMIEKPLGNSNQSFRQWLRRNSGPEEQCCLGFRCRVKIGFLPGALAEFSRAWEFAPNLAVPNYRCGADKAKDCPD
jgi:hypothetical protein